MAKHQVNLFFLPITNSPFRNKDMLIVGFGSYLFFNGDKNAGI